VARIGSRRFHNSRLADDIGANDDIASEWSEERIEQRYDWLFSYTALNI
jgi:salicylate hydroxylase